MRNVNPIEKLERSSLIIAETIQGEAAPQLIRHTECAAQLAHLPHLPHLPRPPRPPRPPNLPHPSAFPPHPIYRRYDRVRDYSAPALLPPRAGDEQSA